MGEWEENRRTEKESDSHRCSRNCWKSIKKGQAFIFRVKSVSSNGTCCSARMLIDTQWRRGTQKSNVTSWLPWPYDAPPGRLFTWPPPLSCPVQRQRRQTTKTSDRQLKRADQENSFEFLVLKRRQITRVGSLSSSAKTWSSESMWHSAMPWAAPTSDMANG